MIMLSGKNKVQFDMYDHVWYATTTCPHMRVGCEHHPEIAGSYAIWKYCEHDEDRFYREYIREMTTEPKISRLKEIVKRSDAGEWFQLIFYEDDPNTGERPYLYKILKELTDNVEIE